MEQLIPYETALRLEAGDHVTPFSLPNQDGTLVHSMADDVAGLPTLLIFESSPNQAGSGFERDLTELKERAAGKSDEYLLYAVTRRTESENRALHARLGLDFDLLSDCQGSLYRAYGLEPVPAGCEAVVFVLDARFRIVETTGGAGSAYLERALTALKALEDKKSSGRLQAHAPVILVERVLSPADCARLMEVWHRPVPVWQTDGLYCDGHDAETGDFKVQGLEPYKVLQYVVRNPRLQRYLDTKIVRRIKPEVEQAFQTGFSKREEYRIAAYDAASGDHLAAHRDNPTPRTRHRRFTVSITLNAEDFEGGALQFREYGQQEYLVETGCAIIWSCALLHEVLPVTRGRRFILGTHFFGT